MNTGITNATFDKMICILQSEYQSLKNEQTYRISIRENAFISNFLAIGAIFSIAFASEANSYLILLLLPLVSSCICWIYLNNDIIVSKFRLYFTDEFPQRVYNVLSQQDVAICLEDVYEIIASWEYFHRKKDRFRKTRKILNSFFILLGFVLISATSIIIIAPVVWQSNLLFIIGWFVDIILTIVMLISLIITKDW